MQVALGQPTLAWPSSPSFCEGRKFSEVEQAVLWSLLQQTPECTSRDLLAKATEAQICPRVTLRQINRWRAKWQRSRGKGRPRGSQVSRAPTEAQGVIRVHPRLTFVGVHLWLGWLHQQNALEPVVARLKEAIQAYEQSHPGEDLDVLHHRDETLKRRFTALLVAPLLGLDRLSDFDTKEHPLETLIGQSYQSSTLSQFLGQLERIDAGPWLMPILLPVEAGKLVYVDGHMMAYWSRQSMHKGKITMRGRIMAGSQAVISHDEKGQAIYVGYYPPDLHLSQLILTYCERVAQASASRLFVIDRAVNSKAMAQAFDESGLGLLCMLDDNEHQGLESFEATEIQTLDDGTRLYAGPWRVSRKDDARHFVIVEPEASKLLVYWGNAKVKAELETSEWPEIYRARTELQENAFKRMIEHGALDINAGRKTILGPDRHQQRAEAKVRESLESTSRRVANKHLELEGKRELVAESEAKGHGKRLEQRQHAAARLEKELGEVKEREAQLQAQVDGFAPPKERADRDFRKQTIMTIRTLFLENLLQNFMAVLLSVLPKKVSLEKVLTLLFERSGSRVETEQRVTYGINASGLSLGNRRMLEEIVGGLNAMGVVEGGKSVCVYLKDLPP